MPAPLRPGDLVDVIAPSGPFDPVLAWRGLGWLSTRYRVRFSRDVFSVHGYLAGNDERRAAELRRALEAPESRAVIAMRGGYGLNRIVHRVDWNAFALQPKWLVGFSDVTALHVEATACGAMSLHACMLAQLGRGHEPTRTQWLDALEHPERPRCWDNLQVIAPGTAKGPLFGGNLAILHACAAAGRLRAPKGAVLFLEDIGERPYRVDRMLTTLLQGGHLRDIAAVALGDFSDCDPGVDGICVADVWRDVLVPLGIPVVAGVPAGHDARNEPLLMGGLATLTAHNGAAVLRVCGGE